MHEEHFQHLVHFSTSRSLANSTLIEQKKNHFINLVIPYHLSLPLSGTNVTTNLVVQNQNHNKAAIII